MEDTTQQTVEMNIPVDENQTGLPVTESNPQTVVAPVIETQPQTPELSTSNPQSKVWFGDSCTDKECEHYKAWLVAQVKKAPPVPGAGRKCTYCENKEKYQTLADEYLRKCRAKTGDKVAIPFIEELADILDKDDETLGIWAKKHIKDAEGNDTEEYEHPEFQHTYNRILSLQKLRLLQRTLGRFNPTGAIFQLKVNHNMIETEKRVLAGVTDEPLLVEIINEDRKNLAENE